MCRSIPTVGSLPVARPHATSTVVAPLRLDDLVRLRRVRDRIDREYAQPLDVRALARGVGMPAGRLSRQFEAAYGTSPYAWVLRRRGERARARAA